VRPKYKLIFNIIIMQVKIALVGKYTNLTDSYLSVMKVSPNPIFNYKQM
jgi:CTP synthase (UTP-ammonia lyase)